MERMIASTSIPMKFKQHVDRLQECDIISFELINWSKELFAKGRKEGLSDDMITECIISFANDRCYTRWQISAALWISGGIHIPASKIRINKKGVSFSKQ